ncbi:MAG: hypothetical protein JWP04_3646, partial [Belnapia sp.]|nr:hypothetical protein [Belnapia sp.]
GVALALVVNSMRDGVAVERSAELLDQALHALMAGAPKALALIEREGNPEAAAGFEACIEELIANARETLRFKA